MINIVGIFGGTFNPIHTGHLIIAQYVLTKFKFDRIVFVPSYIAPYKSDIDMASSVDRLRMIKLSIKGNKKFFCSDFEIKSNKESYTLNTVKHFYNDKDKIFFIIGDEWLEKFDKWHNYEQIFDYTNLIVIRRVYNKIKIPTKLKKFSNKIEIADNPIIDISSSMVRECIKKGFDIKYMVNDMALKYMKRKGIYG